MRCNDCNKFVSFEEQDPEVESLEVEVLDGEATVRAELRLVNACGNCGTELKECRVEGEETIQVPADHLGDGHEIDVVEDATDRDFRQDNPVQPSRYRRTYYIGTVDFTVGCSCGKWSESKAISVEARASNFEEC